MFNSEAMLREELTVGQVLAAVSATGQTSTAASQQAVNALFQVREVQRVKFDRQAVRISVEPDRCATRLFTKIRPATSLG